MFSTSKIIKVAKKPTAKPVPSYQAPKFVAPKRFATYFTDLPDFNPKAALQARDQYHPEYEYKPVDYIRAKINKLDSDDLKWGEGDTDVVWSDRLGAFGEEAEGRSLEEKATDTSGFQGNAEAKAAPLDK